MGAAVMQNLADDPLRGADQGIAPQPAAQASAAVLVNGPISIIGRRRRNPLLREDQAFPSRSLPNLTFTILTTGLTKR
jgi:hypothetical protein